jgi:translation initiation factor IF-3
MLKEEALDFAREQHMDLVVVDHNSTPPTCRLWTVQKAKAKRVTTQKAPREKEMR